MGGLVLIAWAGLARAGCPEVGPLLDAAERRVLEYELDAARSELDRALEAFGCRWATPAEVARALLVEGVAAHLADDPEGGDAAFAAAARTGAATWNPDYGDKLGERFARAGGSSLEGALEVAPAGARVRVDGAVWSGGPLAAGLHLVQVAPGAGPPAVARWVTLSEGTALRLEAGAEASPARPGVEVRVLAAGVGYGRFAAAGYAGVAASAAVRVAGPVSVVAGVPAVFGRAEGVGARALVGVRLGAEVAAGPALRAGAQALWLPQDLGAPLGAVAAVGGRHPVGGVALAWELGAGWCGGGLALAGAGVAFGG